MLFYSHGNVTGNVFGEVVHMKVTSIKEIARLAGVGTSTVSRVINNKSDVNPETKQKVLDVIKKYHFEPNANARNLKQTNSKTVCIVVKGTFNPFFARIVELIQHEIESYNYTPLVRYIEESKDELKAGRRLLTEKKAVGIIFLGGSAITREYINENPDVPFVFATNAVRDMDFPNVSSVGIDDMAAAKMAVDHLFECGHRDIAVVGGKLQYRDLVAFRYDGVVQSFKDHELKFDETNYVECKFSMTDAYTVVSKLLAKKRFTALFAMSDIMAIGAAKAIFDAGLNVPNDISIIGFDGIDMAFFYNPTLATVRQPADEIAIKSVQLLMQNLNEQEGEKHIKLDSVIVKGNSVKVIST